MRTSVVAVALASVIASSFGFVNAQSSSDTGIYTGTTQEYVGTLSSTQVYTSSASATASSTYVVPYYNVSSLPPSSSTAPRTASSNFTLPSATATANFPANFVMQSSTPFVFTEVDPKNLPKMYFTLLNETTAQRQQICDQQTKFCSTAGCAEQGATLTDNFCNVDTMAVMCKCSKGDSNLQQWKWPVQFQDCLRRGNTCQNACQLPGGTTAERNDCRTACTESFTQTCGFPNQYAANYAVSKKGQKPSFAMTQGGTAGNGANAMKVGASVVAIFAIGTSILLTA